MSLNVFKMGKRLRLDKMEFLILRKISDNKWQLQNTATGQWCAFSEDELLDSYTQGDLAFIEESGSPGVKLGEVTLDLSRYAPELVALAKNREQYLKEIDRRQPISITRTSAEPLIRSVSERIMDKKPPGWLTVWRDYHKWISAGRDIRAIMLRHGDGGTRAKRTSGRCRRRISHHCLYAST